MDHYTPASAAPLTTRAQLERISEPWALNRFVAIAITLVLAILLGTWAATGEIEKMLVVALWFTTVMIIVFVQDHWWSPALVICTLQIQTGALGFNLTGMEIGVVILALTFPVKMAMKTLRKVEPEMDPGILFWLLIWYFCIHAVVILGYNKIGGVPLKNIERSYYNVLTPLVYCLLLFRYCNPRTIKGAAIALFVANFITVFFAIITMLLGLDFQPFSGLMIQVSWLSVGGANTILRGATVTLFLGSIAFWPAVPRGWPKFVLGFAAAMSFYGVVMSGGRSYLVTAVAGAAFFAVIRKRLWLALPVIIFASVISGIITTNPDILYSMPDPVQRGLTPFNFSDQKSQVQLDAGASDDWHNNLRTDSIPYWMYDSCSFFLGHGFKAWDYDLSEISDYMAPGDYERFKTHAIEMGLTENMFNSMTNVFGITGIILYLAFLCNLAWRLWKAAHICPPGSAARAMCEFSLVSVVPVIVFCPWSGGCPGITLVTWVLGLMAARPYICAVAPAVKPKELPSFIPQSLRQHA